MVYLGIGETIEILPARGKDPIAVIDYSNAANRAHQILSLDRWITRCPTPGHAADAVERLARVYVQRKMADESFVERVGQTKFSN